MQARQEDQLAEAMDPPPPAAKVRAPAPKKVKENEDGGGEGDATVPPSAAAAQPLADSTPNSQGEAKKSETTAAAESGTSLPPPPPKKAGASGGAGVAKGGSYKPPSWGLTDPPEASGLSLTVLKGGIEVSTISLDNRTHILLGEFFDGGVCTYGVFPAAIRMYLRNLHSSQPHKPRLCAGRSIPGYAQQHAQQNKTPTAGAMLTLM